MSKDRPLTPVSNNIYMNTLIATCIASSAPANLSHNIASEATDTDIDSAYLFCTYCDCRSPSLLVGEQNHEISGSVRNIDTSVNKTAWM